MIYLVSKYPFLHKIDKFYVNLNDQTILVQGKNEKLEPITFWHFDIEKNIFAKTLRMHDESTEKIRYLLKEKNNLEFKD